MRWVGMKMGYLLNRPNAALVSFPRRREISEDFDRESFVDTLVSRLRGNDKARDRLRNHQ